MLDQTRRDQLGTRYRLHIKTLSPLHVGAGGNPLQRRTPDFLPLKNKLIVIDPDKLADVLRPNQLERLIDGVPLSELLEGLRDDQKEGLAAYTFQAPKDKVTTIRPHIKLPGARPYLPGSSLKGALRTALAWAMVQDGIVNIRRQDLGRNRFFADNALERLIFGADPNHDLLRVVHISDTQGLDAGQVTLSRAAVYSLQRSGKLAPKHPRSRYQFHLEVLPAGSTLEASAKRDNYLLKSEVARELKFDARRDYVVNLVRYLNTYARALVQEELDFYQRHGPPGVDSFYQQLKTTIDDLDDGNTCILQVAWGTGWVSKTIGDLLDPKLRIEIRRRYRLGKRGVEEFPKTRRLIETNSGALLPLGWLALTFLPQGEETTPPKLAVPVVRDMEPPPQVSGQRRLVDLKIGEILEGRVTNTTKFGAFVDAGVETDGLIHISKLSDQYVKRVEDIVRRGDRVRVEVIRLEPERKRIGLRLVDKIG